MNILEIPELKCFIKYTLFTSIPKEYYITFLMGKIFLLLSQVCFL